MESNFMESNIDDLEKNRVVTNIENMFLAGRAKKYGIDMNATTRAQRGHTLEVSKAMVEGLIYDYKQIAPEKLHSVTRFNAISYVNKDPLNPIKIDENGKKLDLEAIKKSEIDFNKSGVFELKPEKQNKSEQNLKPAEKAKEVDPAYLANFRFAKGSEPTPEQSKLLDTLNENKYDISSSSDKAEIADLLKKSDLMFDLNATHGLSHDWTGLAKGFDAPSNMNDNKKDYEKNMKEQVVYLPSSYINRISNELNEVEKLLDANEKIQDKLIERNEYNQSNNIYSDLYKSSLSFKDKDDFGFNEYKAKDHICNIKMAIKDYQKSFKLHLPQDIANRIDKASERIVNRNFKRLISEKARTGDTLNYQMKYSTDKRLKPANAAPDLNKDRSKNVERKASEPER
jgi:hypothetical protein